MNDTHSADAPVASQANDAAKTSVAPKATPKPAEVQTVTSSRDVDFPSLNWGISAGATRELPADSAAQAVILDNPYISLTK